MRSTEQRPISELQEGDCFFSYSQVESQRMQEKISEIIEFRVAAGMSDLSNDELLGMQASAMTPYVVDAVVRSTGERCVRRVTDERRFIMYDGTEVVHYALDRQAFLDRLEANKQHRKALEREQSKMNRSRSKKANRIAAEAA